MAEVEDLLRKYATGALSRHTFLRRLLATGVSLGFAETVLGQGIQRALAAPPRQTMLSRGPYFVLIVMDAFRADYLHLASMPNLNRLMQRGTTFERAWVGQLESYTPASHATISTGSTPAHQGVIGFEWRDPVTGKEDYTAWYDDVISGRLELQLKQYGVNSIPLAVKAQDPNARIVSVSSEKYYAADAMGGPAADYILYGLPKGAQIHTTGIPHHLPPDDFLAIPALSASWPLRNGQFDELSMTIALESLRAFDPRVLMINLPGPDIYGHRVGGLAHPAVMKSICSGCDTQIGRIVTAYRDRGILDQTIFVVTGDHGMVRNTCEIDDSTIKQAIRAAGGEYLFHTGGNCAFIWLRNSDRSRTVAAHLVSTIPSAPFAYCLQVVSGSYVYSRVDGPGDTVGPDLEGAYQYLLGTFAGPLSPDIMLVFEEDTITRLHRPKAHGEHGGATWGAQTVPLVVAGPGVPPGRTSTFPARLMDIAPTVLTLLGIEPARMDGVVLTDALAKPTSAQVNAMDAVAPALTRHQTAIRARSEADIAAAASPLRPLKPAPSRTLPHIP